MWIRDLILGLLFFVLTFVVVYFAVTYPKADNKKQIDEFFDFIGETRTVTVIDSPCVSHLYTLHDVVVKNSKNESKSFKIVENPVPVRGDKWRVRPVEFGGVVTIKFEQMLGAGNEK